MKIYSKQELNSFEMSLTYDDISLVPTEISTIKSRTESNTATRLFDKDFDMFGYTKEFS